MQTEAIEQRLNTWILVDVDIGVRLGIPGEELADPQRGSRVGRADQYRVSEGAGDQGHPAEDERAHQQLAQLRIGLDDLAKVLGVDHEQLARFDRARPHQAGPGGEHVDLSVELALAENVERHLLVTVGVGDGQRAGEDDEEAGRRIALLGDDLAGPHPAPPAGWLEPPQLGGGEAREHLLPATEVLVRQGGLLSRRATSRTRSRTSRHSSCRLSSDQSGRCLDSWRSVHSLMLSNPSTGAQHGCL